MTIAFILIVIHYIADFMFQDEDMALGKSKSIKQLLRHTITYTFVFFVFFMLFIFCAIFYLYQLNLGIMENIEYTYKILLFFPITFACHTIIDYFTSKIVSKKFKNKIFYTGIPNLGAFSIIGFDQVLHYATLFLTYTFVIN